jgi:hypothetical protein
MPNRMRLFVQVVRSRALGIVSSSGPVKARKSVRAEDVDLRLRLGLPLNEVPAAPPPITIPASRPSPGASCLKLGHRADLRSAGVSAGDCLQVREPRASSMSTTPSARRRLPPLKPARARLDTLACELLMKRASFAVRYAGPASQCPTALRLASGRTMMGGGEGRASDVRQPGYPIRTAAPTTPGARRGAAHAGRAERWSRRLVSAGPPSGWWPAV